MRPPTRYYTIPLRGPNGAPPRYLAVPDPLAQQQRRRSQPRSTATPASATEQGRKFRSTSRPVSPASSSTTTTTEKEIPKTIATSPPKEQMHVLVSMPAKPKKPSSALASRRARSVPLQEMREAVLAVRDNARHGGGATNDRRDGFSSPVKAEEGGNGDLHPLKNDLHFLKYWEM